MFYCSYHFVYFSMFSQKAGMFSLTFIPFMFFFQKMLSAFYVCCMYLTLHIHNMVQLLDLYLKKMISIKILLSSYLIYIKLL